MSIYLTGDIHGDVGRFKDWQPQSKDDVMIILGDFGVLWYSEDDAENRLLKEKPKLDALDNLGCTILFLDGNHENHDRLKKLETVQLFGAPAGRVTDHVYHLRRGEVYEIEGHSFFCMGGATSVDRDYRVLGESWWLDENASVDDLINGDNNLERYGNKVDYALTHTPPLHIGLEMFPDERGDSRFYDRTADCLDVYLHMLSFKQWFFGHMHFNGIIKSDPRFIALFQKIIRLGDPLGSVLRELGIICATRAFRRYIRDRG